MNKMHRSTLCGVVALALLSSFAHARHKAVKAAPLKAAPASCCIAPPPCPPSCSPLPNEAEKR